MSKLVDGCIPAHTVCPYKEPCGDYAKEHCYHKGIKHLVPYSCAIARSFEITEKAKK